MTQADEPSAATVIAAQAKSLRATIMRNRPSDLPVSAAELAMAVELVELLATEVADLAEQVTGVTHVTPAPQK